MGGYFLGVCFFNCFCFSAWGSFDPICCILELKSLFCMHFGARISHLRAHLAFGFWLLALASLGFGFGRSLHLALGIYNISCNTLHIYIYIYFM